MNRVDVVKQQFGVCGVHNEVKQGTISRGVGLTVGVSTYNGRTSMPTTVCR
jgi:hypothetical protein